MLETSSIKSSGLYVTHDPDSLRGDEGLLKAVRGHDRFYLCRYATCQEEGQHFRQYAVVKSFHAEKFQLATATQGAQQAGAQLFGWMSKGATKAVQKARDLASESETETLQCDASSIRWEDEDGSHRLSAGPCTGGSCAEACLLAENMPIGRSVGNLCPQHSSEYLKGRF